MNKGKKEEMQTTIDIVGVIDDNLFKSFLEETDKVINAFEQYKAETAYINPNFLSPFPSITLSISSYGGSTAIGGAILNRMNEMKAMGIEVNTHCNFAYSMAFIIFVNGVKRTADKFSSFMNHGSASMNSGYIEEQKADIRFSEKMDELFESVIFENTEMSKERVERARLCCDWFGYDEAVEMKVVNAGYDGCEPDWDEVDRKYNQGLALAIQTFAQIMEIEDEDEAIQLLHYGLNEINKQEESKKDETKEEEQEEAEIREITEEMLLEMMGADIPEICRECKHECPNAEAEECQYGEEHKCCRFPNEEDYIKNVGLPKDDDEEHEEEHKCCGKCDNCTCCEDKEVEAKKLYTTLGEHNEQIKEEE